MVELCRPEEGDAVDVDVEVEVAVEEEELAEGR